MFRRLRAFFAGSESHRAGSAAGSAAFGRRPGSALHDAVKHGDLGAVKDLIARGADLEARTRDGWTPLIEAVREDVQIISALLDAGADTNAASVLGYTALQRAAGQGRADVVRLLLSRGANPAAVDHAGKSALDFALGRGATECIDLLTEAGAPRHDVKDGDHDFDARLAGFTEMLGMAHGMAGFCAATGAVQIAGGDGSSVAQAVVIRAPALEMGVAAEYHYLSGRFGPRQPTTKDAAGTAPPSTGWKMLKVGCMRQEGRQFDCMEIIVAGGSAQTIYFDITDFHSDDNPVALLMAHAMSS